MRDAWSVGAGFFIMFMLAAVPFIVIAFNFPSSYRIPSDQPPPVWITQTYAIMLVVGSVLGGYVTAAIARRGHLVPVVVLAGICFVVSLLFWRVPDNEMLFEVVRLGINSGMVVLGGHLQIYRQASPSGVSA